MYSTKFPVKLIQSDFWRLIATSQLNVYLSHATPGKILGCFRRKLSGSASYGVPDTQKIKYLSELGLTEEADQEEIRGRYLDLAKQYHPDSSSPLACAKRFNRIFKAYQFLSGNKTVDEADKQACEEGDCKDKDFGIRHTAPQHRQYLEHEGVGFGTPSERMRQYQSFKVERAVDGLYDQQMKKHGAAASDLTVSERKAIRKTRITKAINRLVEDLIQEAMSKGEFDNLAGSGKPFEIKQHHHIDFTTAKVNQILVDSGFMPEWILLDKEIREEIEALKKLMSERRLLYGEHPLTRADSQAWNKDVVVFEQKNRNINRKIDKFNMVVPILNKQRMHFNYKKHIPVVEAYYLVSEERMASLQQFVEEEDFVRTDLPNLVISIKKRIHEFFST